MSIFSAVLQEVEQKRKAADEAARAAVAEQASSITAFLVEFRAAARAVAKPMFEEFAADAASNGFTSMVQDDTDDARQPTLSVAFAPVKGTRAHTPASEICTYSIRAVAPEKTVLHTVYYDQRPRKDGVHQEKLGIESIAVEILERHLADLARSALQAREDGAAPQDKS
jgi:hypothetical protein